MTNAANERTPGDWTLECDGSLVMGGQVIGIGVDGLGPDHATRAEKKANARLMAAAPDLVRALRGLVAFIHDLDRTHCGLADFAERFPDLERSYPEATALLEALGIDPFPEP